MRRPPVGGELMSSCSRSVRMTVRMSWKRWAAVVAVTAATAGTAVAVSPPAVGPAGAVPAGVAPAAPRPGTRPAGKAGDQRTIQALLAQGQAALAAEDLKDA